MITNGRLLMRSTFLAEHAPKLTDEQLLERFSCDHNAAGSWDATTERRPANRQENG